MIKKKGFTLVELLVVIAIIGTLAGIGFPLFRSMRGQSQEAACLNNLRSLGVAVQGYLQEHQDRLPEMAQGRATNKEEPPVLETVLLPYLESPEAFHCPADKKQFSKTGSSYFWNSTQNGKLVSQLSIFGINDRPDKVPLIYDKEAWHPNKVNFLYGDLTSATKFRITTGN
jgi:prepilin-type N-terminal cleavage/methylation domain-containing protein